MKNNTLIKSSFVVLLILLIISTISIFFTNSNKNKTEEIAKIQTKLHYTEAILDKFLLSNIAMKNMLLSTEMGDRYTHFGNLNSLNGGAILYGDSLRPHLSSEAELKLFDSHLNNQKKYLANITLIDNNLKANNKVGAVKLSLTEFDQISKAYYSKVHELKKHFEEAKAILIEETKNNDAHINTLSITSVVLILVLALIQLWNYKTTNKISQSTLKSAFEDNNNTGTIDNTDTIDTGTPVNDDTDQA